MLQFHGDKKQKIDKFLNQLYINPDQVSGFFVWGGFTCGIRWIVSWCPHGCSSGSPPQAIGFSFLFLGSVLYICLLKQLNNESTKQIPN